MIGGASIRATEGLTAYGMLGHQGEEHLPVKMPGHNARCKHESDPN
jgi:hypothetical protein